MAEKFVGHLMAWKKRDDSDSVIDEDCLLELTEAKDGEVELSFEDRDERCYLRFSLVELLQRVLAEKAE